MLSRYIYFINFVSEYDQEITKSAPDVNNIF